MTILNTTSIAAVAALVLVTACDVPTTMSPAMAGFDVNAARLDTRLDINGDGNIDDEEVIMGNMAVFDTDGSGTINSAERGAAETMLKNDQ